MGVAMAVPMRLCTLDINIHTPPTTVCSLKTLKGSMFTEQHVDGLFRKSITVCRRAYQARY